MLYRLKVVGWITVHRVFLGLLHCYPRVLGHDYTYLRSCGDEPVVGRSKECKKDDRDKRTYRGRGKVRNRETMSKEL